MNGDDPSKLFSHQTNNQWSVSPQSKPSPFKLCDVPGFNCDDQTRWLQLTCLRNTPPASRVWPHSNINRNHNRSSDCTCGGGGVRWRHLKRFETWIRIFIRKYCWILFILISTLNVAMINTSSWCSCFKSYYMWFSYFLSVTPLGSLLAWLCLSRSDLCVAAGSRWALGGGTDSLSFTEPCPADNCEAEATIIMESGHQDTLPPLDTETSRSTGIWRQRTEKLSVSEFRQESHVMLLLLCVLWRRGQGLLLISAKSLHLSWFRSQMEQLMTWDNDEAEGQEVITWALTTVNTSWSEPAVGKLGENWCISRWAHVKKGVRWTINLEILQSQLSGKSDPCGSNGSWVIKP